MADPNNPTNLVIKTNQYDTINNISATQKIKNESNPEHLTTLTSLTSLNKEIILSPNNSNNISIKKTEVFQTAIARTASEIIPFKAILTIIVIVFGLFIITAIVFVFLAASKNK